MDKLPLLLCVLPFMGAFFLAGVGALVWYFRGRRKASETYGWPATQGTILTSGVKTSEYWDSDTNLTTYTYSPAVTYTYTVMGQRYEGRHIWAQGAPGSNSRRKAERIAARYPEGSQVTVYYNPENPADAVLEQGNASGTWVLLVVGITFVIGSLCILLPLLLALLHS